MGSMSMLSRSWYHQLRVFVSNGLTLNMSRLPSKLALYLASKPVEIRPDDGISNPYGKDRASQLMNCVTRQDHLHYAIIREIGSSAGCLHGRYVLSEDSE